MAEEKQALEVEIIAIDGLAPPPAAPAAGRDTQTWRGWQNWQGKARTLNPRWWPLWVLLGLIALVLVLTLGVLAVIISITYHIARRLLLAIFPFLVPHRNGTNC